MVYDSLHIIEQYNSLYNPTNQGFFRFSHIIAVVSTCFLKAGIRSPAHRGTFFGIGIYWLQIHATAASTVEHRLGAIG